ncbi:sensor histidine kinase [Maribacter chungangensis]|uniref:Sensor histidine kinase n=1 Tax=Maribacter chungangensis TaxID=1069117 RepID=A0ABW3B777_9FLAO
MSKLDTFVDHKIAQNLFIWFFLFLIFMTAIQNDNRVLASLFAIILLAPPVYVNNLYILPFFRKSTAIYIVLFLLNTALFTGISVVILNTIDDLSFTWSRFFNFFGILILSLVFASTIKIARDSFTRRQQEKEAELKLLKAQLNPHFLFNTLNNLYGLSVIKSNKLPGLMLKLSDLLRYSLYETKEAMVPLEKEIMYLENYVALEKIRLEDETEIIFTKTGDFVSHEIAPMLLIVFVENAFKHFSASKKEQNSVIISIKGEADSLLFECINSIDTTVTKETDLEKGKSGIGLQNAKKRLALMYPDSHRLITTSTNTRYTVSLEISKIKTI